MILYRNGSVYDLVLKEKLLSKQELDEILQPENMTKPRELTKASQNWNSLKKQSSKNLVFGNGESNETTTVSK